MKEIRKDIPGYEGMYQISNLGNVYSCRAGKNLKGGTVSYGHKMVLLSKNGIRKPFLVHRLVAEAFIANPDNLPIVHHIDENPKNNSIENLKWCTQKENVRYCIESGKRDGCKIYKLDGKIRKNVDSNCPLTNKPCIHELDENGWRICRKCEIKNSFKAGIKK